MQVPGGSVGRVRGRAQGATARAFRQVTWDGRRAGATHADARGSLPKSQISSPGWQRRRRSGSDITCDACYDRLGPAQLKTAVVAATAERYKAVYKALTGEELPS